MIYLLVLLTLLCNPNLQASAQDARPLNANASAAATMPDMGVDPRAVDEKAASAALADVKTDAAATASAGSMLEGASVARTSEHDTKVTIGAAGGPLPKKRSIINTDSAEWREVMNSKIEWRHRFQSREVTSPYVLLEYIDYAAVLLEEDIRNDAIKKGTTAQVLPENIYDMYLVLCRYITFPEDPTMLHTVMVADKFLNVRKEPQGSVASKILVFFDANARVRCSRWMDRQDFDEATIQGVMHARVWDPYCDDLKPLYLEELESYGERFRDTYDGTSASDPARILKKIDSEVERYLKDHTSYEYGDVYELANNVMQYVSLPKGPLKPQGFMNIVPFFWVIELCMYSEPKVTPFSSLRALVVTHLYNACMPEFIRQILTVVPEDDYTRSVREMASQLKPLLLPSDIKLFNISCILGRNDAFLSLYQAKLAARGSSNAGRIEPGCSIEDAQKMVAAGKLDRVAEVTGQSSKVFSIRMRGINSLQGLDMLPDVESPDAILEICANPLSQLDVKPLQQCYDKGMKLRVLSLAQNNLSRINLAGLSHIKTLEELILLNNELVEIEGVEAIIPQLTYLDIRDNRLGFKQLRDLWFLWDKRGERVGILAAPQKEIRLESEELSKQRADFMTLIECLQNSRERAVQAAAVSHVTPKALKALKKKLLKKHGKAHPPNA